MEGFSFYEIDFCVAVLPIQLLMLIYYAMGKRLPLREVRSFFLLMLVNFISMALSLCAAHVNGAVREHSLFVLYGVNILYTCATLTRPYMVFQYMADVFSLGGRMGRVVRGAAFVVYALGEVAALTTPLTGYLFWISDIYGVFRGPFYQCLPLYYGFFLILSAALTLSERQTGRTRSAVFFLALVLMGIGSYWKYIVGYGHILVMGYLTTLGLFILFLFRRNPALYTDDVTGLLSKDALRLVLKDILARHGQVAGMGFALRDFEALRGLYGSETVNEFLRTARRHGEADFPHTYGFYLNGGRFFLLFDKTMDARQSMDMFHTRVAESWKHEEAAFLPNVACCALAGDVAFHTAGEALRSIEMALDTAAKPHGEDVVVDASYLAKARRAIHVQRLLAKAVKHNGVDMFLQPVVDARTGKLEGAEALARLHDEDGKPVSPAEFIPVAESTGAIHSLGLQMIEKACAFIADGGLSACGMKWVNVNVSPAQCLDGGLAGKIDRIRQSYHVAFSQLRLEITEQSTLSSRGLSQVEELHDLGYGIALDDYGSGFSNSGRVRGLPLLEVKLDMELVRSHFKSPDSFLSDVVRIFHDQGLTVVAEGVEYKEWAEALARMGVDLLQGYLFSKPIPAEEFLEKYGRAKSTE